MRGQESPTLNDLLSVTVFKRDFAGIRFLGRKVEVPTLLLSNHYSLKTKDCTIISNHYILLKTKECVPKIAVEV